MQAASRLAEFLNWPGNVAGELSWAEAEAAMGFSFPEDFKAVAATFPTGAFGECIYFVSPIQSADSLGMFKDRLEITNTGFLDGRQVLPDYYPHRFHPEFPGLIPWAVDDDHSYFWNAVSSTESDGKVFFLENTGPDWGVYEGSIEDFLVDILSAAFTHPGLYSDLGEAARRYEQY
ncbi:SMI1/KNR4 family protein [Amycolatopsis silviterrae]|uniref:SMI1/KNR4 family protein n=1 Tax=Amycolatopsis silviterrae TaxID=1656914 RepID=A0ABW5H241_9PSEU